MTVPYKKAMPRGGTKIVGGVPTYGQWDGDRYLHFIKRKSHKAHRLICEAFHGPAESGEVCMHLDENAAHNVPLNLQWGTQKQNLNAPGFLEYCRNRTGENSPVVKGRKKKVHSNV